MGANKELNYSIRDPCEFNLSIMPFIVDGGLFIPTSESFVLGDKIKVNLQILEKKEIIQIEGKVVWITPQNALHHVLPGIGVQFVGTNAKAVLTQIENLLDSTMEVGGYVYGITEEVKRNKG